MFVRRRGPPLTPVGPRGPRSGLSASPLQLPSLVVQDGPVDVSVLWTQLVSRGSSGRQHSPGGWGGHTDEGGLGMPPVPPRAPSSYRRVQSPWMHRRPAVLSGVPQTPAGLTAQRTRRS